jgi:hypothetical protein
MKKLLAALIAILPLAAFAQYEPAPAADEGYGTRRDRWYIGFGIGTGNGGTTWAGTSYTFKDEHEAAWGGSVDPTNVSINFKLGLTLSPTLLVGGDITAVRSQVTEGDSTTGIQVSTYNAVATWFPQGEGFFARGGAGIAKLTYDIDTPYGSDSFTYDGLNLLGGVGYAFWIGQSFNLTVNLDYAVQSYSEDSLESSHFWALWAGFDWY